VRNGGPSAVPQLTPAPLAGTSPNCSSRPGERCWQAFRRTPRANMTRPRTYLSAPIPKADVDHAEGVFEELRHFGNRRVAYLAIFPAAAMMWLVSGSLFLGRGVGTTMLTVSSSGMAERSMVARMCRNRRRGAGCSCGRLGYTSGQRSIRRLLRARRRCP
jgi:hypothetical protein